MAHSRDLHQANMDSTFMSLVIFYQDAPLLGLIIIHLIKLMEDHSLKFVMLEILEMSRLEKMETLPIRIQITKLRFSDNTPS